MKFIIIIAAWSTFVSASGNFMEDQMLKSAEQFCDAGTGGSNASDKKSICKSGSVLDPLKEVLVEQTRKRLTGNPYQENIAKLAKAYLDQLAFEDILSKKSNKILFEKWTNNLPGLAEHAFSDTKIKNEIRKSYETFVKKITLSQLLNLVLGGSTNQLFETNKSAVDEAFAGHSERKNVQEMYEKIQDSYNVGKPEIVKALMDILQKIVPAPVPGSMPGFFR